ncbi:MAG: hypothetical protein F6K54_33880 [Okeania sp. SIO3B5]|uniref:hypothetical protein n=1 Tax=Okeania sp. SIO3B5 TaxID=2607811 RepID=UPI0014007F41|nr:hypothetical protein [Okeania sp. SIO3B5]NEO57623.1 hypothetical protein [Okeania sp. SIO3B5]
MLPDLILDHSRNFFSKLSKRIVVISLCSTFLKTAVILRDRLFKLRLKILIGDRSKNKIIDRALFRHLWNILS